MGIKDIIELTNSALDAARKPLVALAGYMVYATAIQRKGISKNKISAEVISNNESLGIMTGKMPDGTDNVVNAFVINLTENIVDELKENAKIECVIPPGSIVVQAVGGNAGGPITAVGTNTNDASGHGIIR